MKYTMSYMKFSLVLLNHTVPTEVIPPEHRITFVHGYVMYLYKCM